MAFQKPLLLRFIAFLCSCFLICNLLINFNNIGSNAYSGNDFTTSSELADKLNEVFAGNCSLTYNGKSVKFPLNSRLDNDKKYTVANTSGWQCYIYAQGVYYYLFGDVIFHGDSSLKNSKKVISNVSSISYDLFQSSGVSTGAYIRTTVNPDGSYNGSSGHSMIVLSYDINNITILEGNGDGNGLVRIRTLSWSNFNSKELSNKGRKISHIITPNNVTPVCNCSESYIGDYIVSTQSTALPIRISHSASSQKVVESGIPKGSIVRVTKAGTVSGGVTWAHVEWNGYTGYCNMQYLSKNITPSKPNISISNGTSTTNTTITWNSCENTDYYVLRVYNSSGIEIYNETLNSTSWSNILSVDNYKVTITAVSNTGTTNSNDANISVGKTYPGKASLSVSAGNSASNTSFNWNIPPNSDSYQLDIYKSDGTNYKSVTQSTTDYSIVLPTGKYYATVTSKYNQDNTSTKSDEVNFTVIAVVPSTPTLNVLAGNNYTNTVFSWNACDYTDKYTLEVINDDTGIVAFNKTLTDITYEIILSTPGNYSAKVTAINSTENTSAYSKQISFYVEPADVTDFTISITGKSESVIRLDWTESLYATQYDIYRYENGKYNLVGTTTELSFIDTGLYSNTNYQYYVKSSNQWSFKDSNNVNTSTIILTLNGIGTEEEPYQISSTEDLITLSNLINDDLTTKLFSNCYYKQTVDIDMSEISFSPIGTENNVFEGHYNGNYCIINGLNINNSSNYVGLFGYCENATIENISINGNIIGLDCTGGIVGQISNSNIENCAFHGNIAGANNVGGIIGNIEANNSIIRCYQIGQVTGNENVGGIIGQAQNSSSNILYSYHSSGKINGNNKNCGILGNEYNSNIIYQDCYYLQSNATYGTNNTINSGIVAVNEIVLCNLTDTLGEPYVSDNQTNNGYPIFKWEAKMYQFKGNGTQSSPFQIENPTDLENLSKYVNDQYLNTKYGNAYYLQTSDIDMLGIDFIPIGNETYPFNGVYNGGYYNITNLNISSSKYGGLFGYADSITVKNLIVYGSTSAEFTGGIIGECNKDATISQVAYNGNLTGTVVGGIIGNSKLKCNLIDCYQNGSVTGKTAGGLIGTFICGENPAEESCIIKNSYHGNGNISGNGIIGMVDGTQLAISVENSYYLKTTTSSNVNGGIAVNETVLNALAETLESPYIENTNLSLNNGYPVFSWQISKYKFMGNGTEDNPYLIETADDLIALQEYINNPIYNSTYGSAYYLQIADIDLGDMEWTAIGISDELEFNGIYNGDYHTIYGLNAYGENYSGLFGQVSSNTNERNVGIYNTIIRYGTSCSSKGITGGTVAVLTNGATVDNCAVMGDLSGNTGVGGIVGIIRKSGNIFNSYHNGTISGNTKIGGILGTVESGAATIENCYHTVGTVNGTEHIGAIIGYVNSEANVSNCYYLKGTSVGAVDSNSYLGVTIVNETVLKSLSVTLGEAYTDNIFEEYYNDGYPIFYEQFSLETLIGDINFDNSINCLDLIIIKQYILGIIEFNNKQIIKSDINNDGYINILDCIMLKNIIFQNDIT